jgi:hypothetical protein
MVNQLVDKILTLLEQELMLMKEDTINSPTLRHHRSDWMIYKVTKTFSFGMPFERYNDTKERTPNRRLTFVFWIADQDTIR